VKPHIEGLEERLALSVSAHVDYSAHTLVVQNWGTDTITLDHSGGTTIVDNQAFADGNIYNGISLSIGGLSTLNIKANAVPINVEGNEAVAAVNLGNSLHGVQDITAPVNLHHLALSTTPPFPQLLWFPSNSFSLNVDDSADKNSRIVTLNAANKVGTITGLAPATITYDYERDGAGSLDIFGGQAGDFFDVLNTFNDAPIGYIGILNTFGIGGTTIHGNATGGSLTVDVQGVTTASVLNIDAPGSSTAYVNVGNGGTLNGIDGYINLTGHTSSAVNDVYDTTPRHFQVYDSGISLVDSQGNIDPNAPSINYDKNAYASIWGGQGYNTTYEVLGTPSGGAALYPGSSFSDLYVTNTTGPLDIEATTGTNFIDIGGDNLAAVNSVQGINGPITVSNWAGAFNSVTLADTVDPYGHNVSLDSANGWGTIKNLAPATISYANASTRDLSIFTGEATNSVSVNSIDVYTTLAGGTGNLYVDVGYGDGTLDGIHAELDVVGGSGYNYLSINDMNSYYYDYSYHYDANPPAYSWGAFTRTGGNRPSVGIYYMNMGAPHVVEGFGH
jgi:hypothetical protein